MKKAIRVKISAGAGIKGTAKFLVDEQAYNIYKKAGSGKALLIESLLIDSYEDEKYSVLFNSKRFNKTIPFTPFDLYMDTQKNKHTLIESLLLNAENDEKYRVFFSKYNDKESIYEEVKEIEIVDHQDLDIGDDGNMQFLMLEDENEGGDSGW